MKYTRTEIAMMIKTRPGTAAHHFLDGWAEKYLLDHIPAHLHGGLLRFVLLGIPAGSFLNSIVINDLFGALTKADETSRAHLFEICVWLHNAAPSSCYGSRQAVTAWIKRGGLVKREEKA